MKLTKTNLSKSISIGAFFLLTAFNSHSQECSTKELVFEQDFSKYDNDNKVYTKKLAESDMPKIGARTSGGNIRGLSSDFPQVNRVINGELRAHFKKKDASARSGGFIYDSSFTGVEEATLEYKLKFADDFVWRTGGKLPGLGGASSITGNQPAGCNIPKKTKDNAFSCRLMWRSNRANTQKPYLIVYPYLPAAKENCGGDIRFEGFNFQRNKWYTIRQYIKLNSPGKKNGILKMYLNDKEYINKTDMLYRLAGKGNVKINSLIMHTYRGGTRTDAVWQSHQDDYLFFDDFKVWTNCSGIADETVENKKPTVAFKNLKSNYKPGDDVKIELTANDSDGKINKHQILVNGNQVDSDGVNYTPHIIKDLKKGTYTIKAVVTDNDGAKAETSRKITVASDEPKVTITNLKATYNQGAKVVITISKSAASNKVVKHEVFVNNTVVDTDGANYTPYEIVNIKNGNYTVKVVITDDDGVKSEAVKMFTVIAVSNTDDSNDNDSTEEEVGNCLFGTPSPSKLTSYDRAEFNKVYILGNKDPKITNFRRFRINWNATTKRLYQFAVNTTDGVPTHYVNLLDKITYNFADSKSEITLKNTGLSGWDGSYWVTSDGANFVMVSKTKGFTIYFSNGAAPSCNRVSAKFISSQVEGIQLFPNPAKNELNVEVLNDTQRLIEIVTLQGEIVLTTNSFKSSTIDIEHLSPGIYFLISYSNGNQESIPFVKQ